MDASEYRKKYLEQLDRAAEERRKGAGAFLDKSKSADQRREALPSVLREPEEIARAIEIVRDRNENAQLRASTLLRMSIEVGKRQDLIDLALGLLRNPAEPQIVRSAALHVLQQNSFRAAMFAPKRADYLAVLRGLVDDRDPGLRERALEILSQEKDEYAQRRLLAGLKNPAEALIAPHKAIQFLGYDIHAEHYPLLRDMARKAPSPEARKEAVRLLATDSGSKQLLLDLLHDKSESREVRHTSAAALQSLAPQEFEQEAKRIVLDDQEYDDLRAVCLTALAHFADKKALSADTQFTNAVQKLKTKPLSKDVMGAVSGYLSKMTKAKQ